MDLLEGDKLYQKVYRNPRADCTSFITVQQFFAIQTNAGTWKAGMKKPSALLDLRQLCLI